MELHAKLASVGLRFERKGSGAILFVGAIAVKASSVDRAFSMGKLCKRLGEFVPGSYPQEPGAIAPEPISPINLKQWQQYRAECGQETPPASPILADSEITLLKKNTTGNGPPCTRGWADIRAASSISPGIA